MLSAQRSRAASRMSSSSVVLQKREAHDTKLTDVVLESLQEEQEETIEEGEEKGEGKEKEEMKFDFSL